MPTKARFSGSDSFFVAMIDEVTFRYLHTALIAKDDAMASGSGDPLMIMRMLWYFPMDAVNALEEAFIACPH
jgi:hypothetical protein